MGSTLLVLTGWAMREPLNVERVTDTDSTLFYFQTLHIARESADKSCARHGDSVHTFMKKLFSVIAAILFAGQVWADFSATCSSGQTLHYKIISTYSVKVTFPYDGGYTKKPSGELVIPETVSNNGVIYSVTEIGEMAFLECYDLSSVKIPSSVKSIGGWAFYGCKNLKKVEYASIESLCSIRFKDDYSNPLTSAHHLYINGSEITKLVIPNTVTEISNYAFSGCTCLTSSVAIPKSVTSIGDGAFKNCMNLTSITIPNSVTEIGGNAFRDCISLTIYCQAKIKHSDWSWSWNSSDCPVVWGAVYKFK